MYSLFFVLAFLIAIPPRPAPFPFPGSVVLFIGPVLFGGAAWRNRRAVRNRVNTKEKRKMIPATQEMASSSSVSPAKHAHCSSQEMVTECSFHQLG